MKKALFIGIFVSISSIILNAQNASDLFNSKDVKISWLGIDFSHAKLIGSFAEFSEMGTKSTIVIKNKYFTGWNKLILNEAKKYDIKGMLYRNSITNDIDMIMAKNAQTPEASIESYNAITYNNEDITKFVNEYNTEGKSGIGIVFLVENLNKSITEASIYFVAINLSTKEVLIAERFIETPKGIGIRNYWANTFYKMIKDIQSNKYSQWQSKYAKK